MNKFYIALLSISLLVFGCKNAPTNAEVAQIENKPKSTNVSVKTYFNFANKNETIISAHRAGKGYEGFPENCLETMKHLYAKGITTFEIDITETKDGEIILMHDSRLNRTSSGNSYAIDYNSKEIKKFDLKDDFGTFTKYKIPFLNAQKKRQYKS